MDFRVEFDEWTGSVWMRRSTDPMPERKALRFYKRQDKDTANVRNLVLCEDSL